jgi:hypothetical protein
MAEGSPSLCRARAPGPGHAEDAVMMIVNPAAAMCNTVQPMLLELFVYLFVTTRQ